MVTRTDAKIVNSATGGSKSGPPVVTIQVTAPMSTLLPILGLAFKYGGSAFINFLNNRGSYPLFWPTATPEPTISIESRSDSHLRSLKDEAIRCWDVAHADLLKRHEWMHLLGVHDCVRDRLFSPFTMFEALITIPNEVVMFLNRMVRMTDQPDVRILGYRLAKQWIAGTASRESMSGRYQGSASTATYNYTENGWQLCYFYEAITPMVRDADRERLAAALLERPEWAT